MTQLREMASVPWFGARKFARELSKRLAAVEAERDELAQQLARLGGLSVIELEDRRILLQRDCVVLAERMKRESDEHTSRLVQEQAAAKEQLAPLLCRLDEIKKSIVATEELAILQEVGVYQYRHPLSDAVAYEERLDRINTQIKDMTKKDGGAVLAAQNWTVNGSEAQGRTMVREFSKLMLRAFNAEADNLVRGLKPHKLPASIERLRKVVATIERLGKTIQVRIAQPYLSLRERELELTADWVHKLAEEKETERVERERLREERKVQAEMERERARLEKERQHYTNALNALTAKGDTAGADRVRAQLGDVDRAIADVDYRAANIRAGYVYVISNIGSFGEQLVKVGLTRRLDPRDRIRELSDASVPFNFDIHALFFSKDAVGIETALHTRLADRRLNTVNRRREFFKVTPLEVKAHLAELAGELLEFEDVPEALEWRQCLASAVPVAK